MNDTKMPGTFRAYSRVTNTTTPASFIVCNQGMTLISYQSAMLLFIEENSGSNVKETAQASYDAGLTAYSHCILIETAWRFSFASALQRHAKIKRP